MSKKNVRVFIRGARLSFPALDEPRASMVGGDDLKYQATFLLEPNNPCVQQIRAAVHEVAVAEWGARADAILANPDKNPLKSGDAKERIPEGYAGMLYVSAKSKHAPELRDANPRVLITDPRQIREKFVAGYKVNGFVDIYAYAVKNPQGAIVKTGIAAGLVSVQFCAYADPLSGVAKPAESDYPDCSAEASASQTYATSAPSSSGGYGQEPSQAGTGFPAQAGAGFPPPPDPWDRGTGGDVPF